MTKETIVYKYLHQIIDLKTKLNPNVDKPYYFVKN